MLISKSYDYQTPQGIPCAAQYALLIRVLLAKIAGDMIFFNEKPQNF